MAPGPESAPPAWPVIESEILQDCRVFRVARDLSRSPRSGEPHPFYRLESSDWVNVVAVTADEQLVMIRQYRHGSREVTLEIPGGLVDPGESPAEAAARELLEETGYRAPEVEPLGVVNPNPALFGNRCHTFLASGAKRVAGVRNEGNEETWVELVPRAELDSLLRGGVIDHALVIAGLFWYRLHAGGVPR